MHEVDRNVSRAIVDEDEEVVESANDADLRGTLAVHKNILEEVGGLSLAETIWLAVKFSKSTASAESHIRRFLIRDRKSNNSLSSCHLINGLGPQVSTAFMPHDDWGCNTCSSVTVRTFFDLRSRFSNCNGDAFHHVDGPDLFTVNTVS